MLLILKLLSKTVFADRKCNVEGCDFVVPPNAACYEQFLTQHTDLNVDIDSLLSQYIYVQKINVFKLVLNSVKLIFVN